MLPDKHFHRTLLVSTLLMLAGLAYTASAYADSRQRCCAGPACSCCCDTADSGLQEALLQAAAQGSTAKCSCSTGPNPFGRKQASAVPADTQGKQFPYGSRHCFTRDPRSEAVIKSPCRDKPPSGLARNLYLATCSLLI